MEINQSHVPIVPHDVSLCMSVLLLHQRAQSINTRPGNTKRKLFFVLLIPVEGASKVLGKAVVVVEVLCFSLQTLLTALVQARARTHANARISSCARLSHSDKSLYCNVLAESFEVVCEYNYNEQTTQRTSMSSFASALTCFKMSPMYYVGCIQAQFC